MSYFTRVTAVIAEYNVSVREGSVRVGREGGGAFCSYRYYAHIDCFSMPNSTVGRCGAT